MYNTKQLQENYEVISEICRLYRKEITVFQGLLGESTGLISCSEYSEFMNTLPMESFIGNLMGTLMNDYVANLYKDILDGSKKFDEDIVELYLPTKYYKKYLELV